MVGIDGFNAIWTSPDTLPLAREITDPGLGPPGARLIPVPIAYNPLRLIARSPTLLGLWGVGSLGNHLESGGTRMDRPGGRPHPAMAAVRVAVRAALADAAPGDLVLVACSGGADSLALAAATAFEARATGIRAGAVVVDHGLHAGSTDVAATAAATLRGLGLDPVEVVPHLAVGLREGLEAAAREARHAALEAVADRLGGRDRLLGHTRDDQAEQVLLGLARARALARWLGCGRPRPTSAPCWGWRGRSAVRLRRPRASPGGTTR